MIDINTAKEIIADQYSEAELAAASAEAEKIGYKDAEEFFSIAMAVILYGKSEVADGARYPVENGSLDEYFAG